MRNFGILFFVSRHLSTLFPLLAARIPACTLASLPTPVSTHDIVLRQVQHLVCVKHDELSGPLYGGNKVRKLEYLLQRARDKQATRVATFGAAGSNHALATALYAKHLGFDCTCLLSHQPDKPAIARALRIHQSIGTEIVRFGGDRKTRVAILRANLQHRNACLIPMGGTTWLGCLGFVNAGLELAAQINAGEIPAPVRIYVAMGTMGTAVGLALGLALANLDIEIHAVRVTDRRFANPDGLARLAEKTALLMHRYDASIPAGIASRLRIVFREDFYGEGYGRSNEATDSAIDFAAEALGITLESTYTGKAMAAMLKDLRDGEAEQPLFWNTYSAVDVDYDKNAAPDYDILPPEFSRYFG